MSRNCRYSIYHIWNLRVEEPTDNDHSGDAEFDFQHEINDCQIDRYSGGIFRPSMKVLNIWKLPAEY